MGEMFTPMHLMILSVVAFFYSGIFVVPFWFIFKKAGFSPFLSLLMIVPFVNIGMLYMLAFAAWKPSARSIDFG